MRHFKIRRFTSSFACLAVVVLAAGAAHAQSPPVLTTLGYVQGNSADSNGVTSFKGIPFAAPPVGPLRWRAPQPAPHYSGVLSTRAYGATCLAAFQPSPTQSEDCLTANVWTPDITPATLKPVMVWIYGGGFQYGSSDTAVLDGSHLANDDVVVVTFNYRVGVMGFLATSQLDAESGTSGNWGLLDSLAALKWVKANIANFGGDPNRVTIFGESAGAHSVGMLLASPLTRGLVNGAIMESGAFWDSDHGSIGTHTEKLALGAALAAKFPDQDLRSIDGQAVNAAAQWDPKTDPSITAFSPSVDGNVLRVSPGEAFARGQELNVPLMGGWNTAEYFPFTALFAPTYPDAAALDSAAATWFGNRCLPQFEAVYPATTPAETMASSNLLAGDTIISEQTWEALAIPQRPGTAKRFAYHFTYTSPYSPSAIHTSEVPFVWGSLTPEALAPAATPSAADRQLSAEMMSYWTNFAHKGDPNGPGLPAWPAFTGLGGSVMQLDSTSPAAGPNTDEGRFAFLASYRSHGRMPADWRTMGVPGDTYPGVGCGTATFKP